MCAVPLRIAERNGQGETGTVRERDSQRERLVWKLSRERATAENAYVHDTPAVQSNLSLQSRVVRQILAPRPNEWRLNRSGTSIRSQDGPVDRQVGPHAKSYARQPGWLDSTRGEMDASRRDKPSHPRVSRPVSDRVDGSLPATTNTHTYIQTK